MAKHIFGVKFFLLVSLVTISVCPLVNAKMIDQVKEPQTVLGSLLTKKGVLLVKEFVELGKIHGRFGSSMEFDAVTIYEPGDERKKRKGMKVEVKGGGKYERSSYSLLDLEELESLSKAVAYMDKLHKQWKGNTGNYKEVIFVTKGGFKVGFYQKDFDFGAFAESGRISKATCFLQEINELDSIKRMADKALSILKK